jgi:O-antigen/teichoic acid export membrane protein
MIINEITTRIKESRLCKDMSWMFLSTGIANLLRFFLVFIVIRCYTQEQFGLWASITSIAAIIVTGDFGLTNVLRNEASKNMVEGKEGEKKTERCYYSVMYFFLVIAILFTFFLITFNNAIPFEKLFKTDDLVLKQQGHVIIAVVLIIFFFNIPFSICAALFFSYDENRLNAITSFISGIVSFFVVGSLSLLGTSIVLVSILYFLCPLIVNFATTIYFIRRRHWYNFKISPIQIWKDISYMLPLGIKFLVLGLSSSFIYNLLTVYSGSLLGLKQAANVNVAQKIFTFFSSVYQSIFNPVWSKLSNLYFHGQKAKCKQLLSKSIVMTVCILFLVIFSTTIFSNILIRIIAGKGYTADKLMFVLVGACLLFKTLFDNISLLQVATSKINGITIGYLLFTSIAFLVFPQIVKYQSFNMMMICLIACWVVFCLIIGEITFRKYLKTDDSNQLL